MTKTHVPKFGDWERGNDDIPYTAYFESARRERGTGGLYMNHNDPQQNPDVLNDMKSIGNTWNHQRSRASESGSDRKSHSGRPKVDSRDGVPRVGTSSFSSDTSKSKHRARHRSSSSDDNNKGHERVGSIPKFGAWDENDPTSGEGFTFIFQRARKDKDSPFSVAAEPAKTSPRKTDYCSQLKSKVCCCLFPYKRG